MPDETLCKIHSFLLNKLRISRFYIARHFLWHCRLKLLQHRNYNLHEFSINFPTNIPLESNQTKPNHTEKYDDEDERSVLYAYNMHTFYTFIEPFLFIFGTFLAIRLERVSKNRSHLYRLCQCAGGNRKRNFSRNKYTLRLCIWEAKQRKLFYFPLSLSTFSLPIVSHSFCVIVYACEAAKYGQKVQVNLIVRFEQYVRNSRTDKVIASRITLLS